MSTSHPSRDSALAALAAVLLLAAPAAAQPDGVELFEKRIRPVLVERCYGCHSADALARKKLRGGLRLDSRAGLLKGGDTGPVVVPGKPDDSRLLHSLKQDGDLRMPPGGKLPDAVIADFEAWIRGGAADPRDDPTGPVRAGTTDPVKGRDFWAYRPPQKPPLPAVRAGDWPVNDIDHFVLARLEAAGLRPAPDAPREVLIRRLSYDLTGLPPSPEDVAAFAADPDPAAYEKLVGRLLASPAFGERWGRHWLDVARYGESVTLRGFVFPDAWRYRDYVLDAFNRDVPYDRFVREQLAGDLLPAATPEDRRRQLVATTYLMLGNTNLEEQDKQQLRMDVVDEQLDVIGKGLLAQTITCARCHDHKFDPIPQRDYYALAGILRSTRTMEHANVSKWTEVPLPAPPEVAAGVLRHRLTVAALGSHLAASAAEGPSPNAAGQAALKRLQSAAPKWPTAMTPVEEKTIEDARINVRGSARNLGETVPRGFLSVATVGPTPPMPRDHSGRVELAEWVTARDNPLTARVWANRAWHWLFGDGLVRTVDNFGSTGEAPSHPELLDRLAVQFMEDGWSTKRLVRRIVLSRTYRQASAAEPLAVAADPDNRLFGRANRRRLDAECLRDTMLTVSGKLTPCPGGPTFPAGLASDYGFRQTATCRSVYLPVFRNALPEIFAVFDFADPSTVTGRRSVSTVAPQALFLMNNPFVLEQSRHAAERLLAGPPTDDAARLDRAYRLTLGRPPSDGERAVAVRFLADGRRKPPEAWAAVFRALFASADFRYVE